jgi:hypothetical protein
MSDYEKLGAFYLGRPYDLPSRQRKEGLLLYDSKDLVTHAACFGMTGSGKTGLCTVLLEEAAIDGVPAIVVDPKGDLANLLLTFPELAAKDFAQWSPEGTARQKGLTQKEYGAEQAKLWKKGLASWGQDGNRIRRLRESADFSVYTPGSEAGLSVSLLKSFAAPSAQVLEDRELMRERIQATVTSLLGLLGIDADPIQSREHILLSNILDRAWREGRNLDLPALITQVQKPPFERVGMFDLESFYPSKDRFGLAMTFNNVLASPGFEAWLQGEPLNLDRMLHSEAGRPRVSIFSIAHLNDAERMFFVSTLLNETVSWMRRQSGTTSLRALLYMDEIFGYFPPVANPPSKAPLMTLLKQGRAFGLGAVLATQNPMDLDYKGLGNCGTWFVGRLQTDRDQARVLDGLAGAVAGAGEEFDRQKMEQTLAGLGKRVFLMYNVHDAAPEVFETRWALSYLCGPLTREQIKKLTAARKEAGAAPDEKAAPAASPTAVAAGDGASERPALPPQIPQTFLPIRTVLRNDAPMTYEPTLFAEVRLHFANARAKVSHSLDLRVVTPIVDEAVVVDWQQGETLDISASELEKEPPGESGAFGQLPAEAANAKNFSKWNKRLVRWLYTEQRLTLYKSPALKETSQPGESEGDFRVRLEMAAREERDRQVDKLRKKFAPKVRRLEERIRKAEAVAEREQQQAKQQKMQSAISIGAGLLGAFLGRKVASRTNLRTAGSAFRSMGRSRKEAGDVGRALESLEAYRGQLADLESDFESETEQIEAGVDPRTEELDAVEIRPKKADIDVRHLSLAWAPLWRAPDGSVTPAWR